MEPKKKQTRKSVPRPNSGRRAVDGATDLVKVGIRLTPAQHEWVKAKVSDQKKYDEGFDRIWGKKCDHDWCSDGDPGQGEVMVFTCSRCGKESRGVPAGYNKGEAE